MSMRPNLDPPLPIWARALGAICLVAMLTGLGWLLGVAAFTVEAELFGWLLQ